MTSRRPAVAGRFYSAAPGELTATVDALLAAARGVPALAGPAAGHPALRALVVPHAGYIYSGPVAATAYACLARLPVPVRRVVLLGPAHYVPLDGVAASAATTWRTPLGEVPAAAPPGVPLDERAHRAEHALEVQLPFLQRVLPAGFGIVPIAVGRTSPGEVADLIDRLEDDDGVGLVVVSTDLSHYHDAATAARLDQRTADAVLARDAPAIGPRDACGSWALRGLVEHARRHDRQIRLLDLRTSADTSGDPERVVGYGAFAITGPEVTTSGPASSP